MYQCGHSKSSHDFFSRVVFLGSTCCHQSVLSSAKLSNTKRGSFIFSLVLIRIIVTISIIFNCHKHLSWQLASAQQRVTLHKNGEFWENTKVLRTNLRRIYKVPFSDFTPIPTFFRILIAHSTTIKCLYIGPLPHLFRYQKNAFNRHTNIYCLPYTFLSILQTVGSKIYKFKWGPNFFHTQQQVAFQWRSYLYDEILTSCEC